MNAFNGTKLIEAVKKVVIQAASLMLSGKPEGDSIKVKGEANFVTDIDLAVQEYLVNELKSLLPGSAVLSEEMEHGAVPCNEFFWILDPVDGTTNLMYDYRLSAISLALVQKGEIIMGIVHNPFTNEFFHAIKDNGSFLNGKKIEVTKNLKLSDCLVAFGTTPYDKDRSEEIFRITRNIFEICRDVRRTGSAALDIVYTACGRLDGFFELKLQPWDYSAGMLIVSEAGGISTDIHGGKIKTGYATSFCTSNSFIHDELLKYFEEVR